jgi:alpha-tubulin suppressor-like RCC1 family protein
MYTQPQSLWGLSLILVGMTLLTSAQAQSAPTFSHIAAGSTYTCGSVGSNRKGVCWGSNTQGQLGNGSIIASEKPIAVTGLTGIEILAAAKSQACALTTQSTLYCWGTDNLDGEAFAFKSRIPQPLELPKKITQIALGDHHACFLTDEETLYCQGSNQYGQLGALRFGPKSASPQELSLSSVTGVAAGSKHTCAVLQQTRLYCWGAFLPGTGSYEPTFVAALGPVKSLGAGDTFSCALLVNGQIFCWGSDEFGQLGNGSLDAPNQIAKVNGITTATHLAVGGYHACALLQDQSVHCWGANILGQLGNGSNRNFSIPDQVQGISQVIQVSAGEAHTCVVREDQKAFCWGHNHTGQLGNGSRANSRSPIPVANF